MEWLFGFNTEEVIQGGIFMDLEQNSIDFLDSGFTNLNSKICKLIPIIKNYQLKDLIIAIFATDYHPMAPSGVKGRTLFQLLLSHLPDEHKTKWFAGAALN